MATRLLRKAWVQLGARSIDESGAATRDIFKHHISIVPTHDSRVEGGDRAGALLDDDAHDSQPRLSWARRASALVHENHEVSLACGCRDVVSASSLLSGGGASDFLNASVERVQWHERTHGWPPVAQVFPTALGDDPLCPGALQEPHMVMSSPEDEPRRSCSLMVEADMVKTGSKIFALVLESPLMIDSDTESQPSAVPDRGAFRRHVRRGPAASVGSFRNRLYGPSRSEEEDAGDAQSAAAKASLGLVGRRVSRAWQ